MVEAAPASYAFGGGDTPTIDQLMPLRQSVRRWTKNLPRWLLDDVLSFLPDKRAAPIRGYAMEPMSGIWHAPTERVAYTNYISSLDAQLSTLVW